MSSTRSNGDSGTSGEGLSLIFRLSSLGDVVLATAALSALPEGHRADWVVRREYAGLLEGHPRVRKVWSYDRRSGRAGWRQLLQEIGATAEYSDIYDLHRSWRTALARFWSPGSLARAPWHRVSKQRGRLWGYYIFKKLWPQSLRPTAWVKRHAELVGAPPARPDLTHLLRLVPEDESALADWRAFRARSAGLGPVAMMPGSLWPGKRWPKERFLECALRLKRPIVVLGTAADGESVWLANELRRRADVEFLDGVGKWNFRQLATVLRESAGYLGNDTGLSHLAEAVGGRAMMIMGPTAADMGFGPWRDTSEVIVEPIWCRPCGKDGSHCHRVFARHACMQRLSVDAVLNPVQSWLERSP